MIKRIFNVFPPILKIVIGSIMVQILRPFDFNQKIFSLSIKIKHTIGYYRVIKKGNIAIQGGIDYTYGTSFIEPISKAVGKKGIALGIEPSPNNIRFAKKRIKNNPHLNNIILVEKAISNIKGEMSLLLGEKGTWNRIEEKLDVFSEKNMTDNKIKVKVDTIDNIIKEHNINPQKICFVSLTINGQEYNGLKGMKNLLQVSNNISINVVAGRTNILGTIKGKTDTIIISEFLEKFGFQTKYIELKKGVMGYIMAKKGNSNFFMP